MKKKKKKKKQKQNEQEEKDLKVISNDKYYVKDYCIYKSKKDKEICNFCITNLTINYRNDIQNSFTIELETVKIKRTATLPIYFMNDPSGWLYYGFDPEKFYSLSVKNEFDETLNDIINLMIENGLCTHEDKVMGWRFFEVGFNPLENNILSLFKDFDDPLEDFYYKDENAPTDYIREYSNLVGPENYNILFSYMLLSLLNSFDLLGKNIRPDFTLVLTGGNETIRSKLALLCTNLFNRDHSFRKTDYKMIHIMNSDPFSEIRFKSEYAKDCVLIAFEPTKRQLRFLLNDVYGKRIIDKKRPIRNLCLITTEELENIYCNVINISIPKEYNLNKVEEYFKYDDPRKQIDGYSFYNPLESKDDNLIVSIQHYISILIDKLEMNSDYVYQKFAEFKSNQYFPDDSDTVSNEAKEAATLLSFAYWLYMSEYHENLEYEISDDIISETYDIYNTAINSFLIKGQSKNIDFEKAKKICTAIDSFFENTKDQSKLKEIGSPNDCDDVRMWYDEDYLYIKSRNIKEILDMKQIGLVFNINIKIALSEKELIKTYTKKDNKPEYSVHIQKNLHPDSKDKKTKYRYVAFNRRTCRQHKLFKNIEEIILNRCQKDVKSQKTNDIEES